MQMTKFSRPILDYWHKIFSEGDIIASGEALSITVNATLNDGRQAMILEYANGYSRAAITPRLADRMAIQEADNISTPELRRRLTDVGAELHDPDFIFYFRDAEPFEQTGKRATECRQLSEADRDAFALFEATASEQDLDDAYVELDHWGVFGIFLGDRLVSAASMYPWGNASIADLGVLTLPEFRGSGYARTIVATISRFARSKGFEPQYRCQLDNHASIALAKASGLILFGKWEVTSGALDNDAS
jgi:RimJ/RimL family protein N-acetyltransferase